MSDVLFCTDTFWEAWGDQVTAIAPDIESVLLVGEEPVAVADLERITISFFSHDAWPVRAGNFFGVALRADNLAWLHSMSSGVDSPIFRTLRIVASASPTRRVRVARRLLAP